MSSFLGLLSTSPAYFIPRLVAQFFCSLTYVPVLGYYFFYYLGKKVLLERLHRLRMREDFYSMDNLRPGLVDDFVKRADWYAAAVSSKCGSSVDLPCLGK